MNRPIAAAILTALLLSAPNVSAKETDSRYLETVQRTANMVGDSNVRQLASKYGLDLVNVTWEDTGRYKGSSVGPNISDMTLQVETENSRGQRQLTCLPVIRFPNFSDKTADIDPDRFFVLVGNEAGKSLRKITLTQFLGDPRAYMTHPETFKGDHASMLASRDSHVLVSAQACFLPIPEQGKCTFNPVLFNYSSYAGDPGVLSILVTREGTSMTVIDNKRDGFDAGATWGQRLFFNQNGQRASLTGERKSDFVASQGASHPSVRLAEQEGLNMVLLIQVPLKQKNPLRMQPMGDACCEAAPPAKSMGYRGMEQAVIGHGEVEGPFTEVDNLAIERDERFPVRVTVQFYQATSDGKITADDMGSLAKQIDKVYSQADYVGSLVTGGETGRPTEHSGDKNEPAGWWGAFWQRHNENTGQSREDTLEMLRKLFRRG
ncbi:MAG: hypothetical protein AMXMBFR33_47340 [Candidatus Xenobia bacterium]